ncbi:hypothetical protein HOU03_gp163 [Caulobacter phage CcrSC]|uniref:Uncharacterized protein n=1 Tax=Caulobacter phage CcrSC TaxID=2283272 RepID=A0A385EF02_9CAUD|nr:hypothetical protein HOU03_gp023 [Caulobacter phage CcrSC]YP_009810735.1 hypothetical protein HOU03_gp163 [Caulobacter phage CcrSC]AXQ69605.1 hypothetical protein CcrSC_gp023 [Caulobacter phage CcrSC]AXQ70105.1 hypothetical protein CcrSC_gp523 [Caulobacter phage CcrSC]
MAMPLGLRTTATSYAIDVDDDQFLAMIQAEGYKGGDFEPSLFDKLQKTPARDIEYNGHFGASVYFTLTEEDDTPALRAELGRMIAEHLTLCVAHMATYDKDA